MKVVAKRVTESHYWTGLRSPTEITNKMDTEKLLKRKQRASKDGNIRQLAEVIKDLGDMYFETGQLEKALQEYLEQVNICECLNDKLNCAVAHRMIGEVYASLGDYENALIHQNLHLEGAIEVHNLLEEQRAFATLGRTHFCLAESLLDDQEKCKALLEAKKAYEKSIKLCDELENTDIKFEELMTMRARLFLNLGLILEAQKDIEEGIELIKKAAELCLKYKLYDDLHRVNLALGAIYERVKKFELAKTYLDKAAEVDNIPFKADAQLAKAQLSLKLGNWLEARKLLVTLYLTKGLPQNVNQQIEQSLRIAVTLMKSENTLLETKEPNKRLKLYEVMGDAAVEVQCFDKAIDYYHNMLTCAEKTGSKEMSAALISLAQTLRDAGQSEEAVIYARRELLLSSKPSDICRSSLFLADLLASTDSSEPEIREYLNLALSTAKKSGNVSLEVSALKEYLTYLQKSGHFSEAKEIKEKLDNIVSKTAENIESEDEEETLNIGADICLEELSDIEERLNNSDIVKRKRGRRRHVIKRNEKGETQLHIACINGNIDTVEKLLEEGHPTDVRDHCGWTPLHEAANHGYVEIARLLIKNGANVNDRGGNYCGGVTPIHDAASCGHVPMICLLMECGSDLSLKTEEGSTVLDCLEDWRERVKDLSSQDQLEYDFVHKRLLSLIPVNPNRRKINNVSRKSKSRWLSIVDDEETISVGEDYKRTIANLKHRGPSIISVTAKPVSAKKVTPLLDSDEVVDDWLEDDISQNMKRKASASDLQLSNKRKPSNSVSLDTEKDAKRQKFKNYSDTDSEQFERMALVNEDSTDSNSEMFDSLSRSKDQSPRKKAARQINLLASGFTKDRCESRTPSPITTLNITQTISCNKRPSLHAVLNLQILIDEKQFNVKVRFPEEEKRTIGSIANEIATKFFNETGCKTKLVLRAMDGNELSTFSTLSSLKNFKDIETLSCELVDLEIPALDERYKTICKTYNTIPDENILKCLKLCENAFELKIVSLNDDELIPILKSLEYQRKLEILRFSGGTLLFHGEQLNQCITKLTLLQEIYLQGCEIDCDCLTRIEKLPSQITTLDLSYNPLKVESENVLYNLILPLKYLKTLNLRYCELSKFRYPAQCNSLMNLDLSWNPLEWEHVYYLQKQMCNLNLCNTVKYNNLSVATSLTHSFKNALMNVQTLNLSSCYVVDFDVKNILRNIPNLTIIILNGNPKITVSSVNILLSYRPTLRYIDVSGCNPITKNPDPEVVIQNPSICTLIATISPESQGSWLHLWRGESNVEKLPHNIIIIKPK
ncbi:tonsoku-like protein [Prorops nasuta]|uniref:tonsoku-like protein n=1 Tax=Prorops nasuta TaxID=863751 RepID=UPI0034CEE0CC